MNHRSVSYYSSRGRHVFIKCHVSQKLCSWVNICNFWASVSPDNNMEVTEGGTQSEVTIVNVKVLQQGVFVSTGDHEINVLFQQIINRKSHHVEEQKVSRFHWTTGLCNHVEPDFRGHAPAGSLQEGEFWCSVWVWGVREPPPLTWLLVAKHLGATGVSVIKPACYRQFTSVLRQSAETSSREHKLKALNGDLRRPRWRHLEEDSGLADAAFSC